MFQAIAILVLILYVAIAGVIFKDYRNTRNVGFLIVGCGVLLWPLLGGFLMRVVTQAVLSGGTEGAILLISTYAYKAVQAGLILIGFLSIERSLNVIHPRVADIQQ